MKFMDTKQKLQLLEKWQKSYEQNDAVYAALKQVLDVSPESPAIEATWGMFDSYTDALSIILEDNNQMLGWYAWDNQFGKKKLAAKCKSWKRFRPITNLKTLLKYIEDK